MINNAKQPRLMIKKSDELENKENIGKKRFLFNNLNLFLGTAQSVGRTIDGSHSHKIINASGNGSSDLANMKNLGKKEVFV